MGSRRQVRNRARRGATTGTFRSAARHRRFSRLLAHHVLAGTAQSFGTVAVAVAVWDATGSAGWVGVAAASRLVPFLVFSGAAGALSDRMDRCAMLRWSSWLRAVTTAALVAAVATDAPPATLVGLVFVTTSLGTGCFPALMATIPTMVPGDDVPPATALLNTVETAAWLVGPAIGGLLLLGGRPEVALALNVLLFVGGAAVLTGATAPAASVRLPGSTVRGDVVAAARTLVRSPTLAAPLTLVVGVNLVVGATPVLSLLAAEELVAGPPNTYSLLVAAFGIGGFAGILVTNRLASAGRRPRDLEVAAVMAALPLAVLAVPGVPLPAALVAIGIAGAGAVLTEVVTLTRMLRVLDPGEAGRVFGLVDSALVASVLAGSLLAPALAAAVGPAGALVTLAVPLPVVMVAVSRRRARAVPSSLSSSSAPASAIASDDDGRASGLEPSGAGS